MVRTRYERQGVIEIVLVDVVYAGYWIVIREVWVSGLLKRYGYQLLHGDTLALRYGNAPRHPELDIFPHHRHRGSRVEPLRGS